MKSNRNFKASLGILSLAMTGLLVSACGLATNHNASFNVNVARKETLRRQFDPSGYTHVSSSELTTKIRDYTGTSLSRHYSVQFESVAIKAFYTRYKDVFSVVDDPNYTGDMSSPFVDPSLGKYLNGYIIKAESSASTDAGTIYLHSEMKYGSRFIVKNTKVVSNCMYLAADYSDVTSIYVCSGIETIESGAFVNVPNTVTIKCVAASKPAGWADDWTDAANVEWGQALPKPERASQSISSSTERFGDAKDYILGYQGNDEKGEGHIDPYPLTFKYDKQDKDGNVTTHYQEIAKKHLTNPYDAVGTNIYGTSNSFSFTVDLEKGESVVEGSEEFYNIFYALKKYNDVKTEWPVEEMNQVYGAYEGLDATFPSLEGTLFSSQLYETLADKYITISAGRDTDAEAQTMVDTYKGLIEGIKDEDDNQLFVHDSENYELATYGYVYRREVVSDAGEHFAMFAQFYAFDKHFVSYFIIDHMVQNEENGDGKYSYSRALPITPKHNAVRPYNWIPDFDEGYLYSNATPNYGKMTSISDIFDISYTQSSAFCGYTSVGMNATKKFVTAYAAHPVISGVVDASKNLVLLLKDDGLYYNGDTAYAAEDLEFFGTFKAPQLYIESSMRTKAEININSIVDGAMRFRYTLTDFNNAIIVVKYLKNGVEKTKEIPFKSPSPVVELNGDKNSLSFLVNNSEIEGVSAKDVLAVGVSGVSVNIHLYNASSHAVVQNTSLIKVFGNIEVLPHTGKALTYFNIDLYLILFSVILTVIFIAGTVALFIYRKNKYKNDEFRRVRPKQFFKTAAFVYLGLMFLTLAINFIVMRFAVFGSSVPVFNPIDPFVIVFAIAGAISLGLFIRMFVIIAKANKSVKETKRLRLDKDVADDGTH